MRLCIKSTSLPLLFSPSTFTFIVKKITVCEATPSSHTYKRWASSQCVMCSEQEVQHCSRPGRLSLPYANSNPLIDRCECIYWGELEEQVGWRVGEVGLWQLPLQINSLFNYWEVHGIACCCGVQSAAETNGCWKCTLWGYVCESMESISPCSPSTGPSISSSGDAAALFLEESLLFTLVL